MEICGVKRFEWWTEGPGDRLCRVLHVGDDDEGGLGTVYVYKRGAGDDKVRLR